MINASPAPDNAAACLSERSLRRLTPREMARTMRISMAITRHILPSLLRKKTRTPEHLAPRVRKVVVSLGPPFVKLSQVVSSSPGLFPAPISNELRYLLDEAPPEPWPKIKKAIEQRLNAPIGTLFASIDEQPVAAASIAQVHAATLHDGTPVVVKVRRPGVERKFLTDLRQLRILGLLANRFWKSARVLNPVGIVEGIVANLRMELDFNLEAASMERFEDNLRKFGDNDIVRVPVVHHSLSGPGVLTMERIDGIKVDDLPNLLATGFDLLGLLKAGVRSWIEAACEHGFFHGDVHAGNLMVDRTGKVVFLDFGIMGELDEATRLLVRRGVVALLYHNDFDEVARCLVELGAQLGHRTDEARAAAAIQRLVLPELSKSISEIDYLALFSKAVRMAAPKGVQLPRSLVLLAKQVLYFERYAKLVAPDYDILSDTWLIEFMIDDDEEPDNEEAVPARR